MENRSNMARILITGLKAYGYHGCTRREKEEGQVFLVDVELEYDAAAAVQEDDLSRAVDYDRLASEIHSLVTGNRFQLIETLAARIGGHIMESTPVVTALVRVHKPKAPMGCEVEDVAVEMTFQRGEGDEPGFTPG